MNQTKNITVHLNDGKTRITSWSQDFSKFPTLGEWVDIDTMRSPIPDGYETIGMISKIAFDSSGRNPEIHLDAVAAKNPGGRPAVLLNSSYIPEPLARRVEDHLRTCLELPTFEWVRSNEPRPLIDVHVNPRLDRRTFRKWNDELRNIVIEASPLAVIG